MQYTRNNFSLHDFSFCRYRFLTHLTLTWYAYVVFVVVIVAVFFPLFFHIHFFLLFIRFISCFFFSLPLVLIFLFASIRFRSALLANGKKRFSVVEEEKRRITSKVREKNAEIYVRFLFSFTLFDVSESYTHTQPYHTLKVRINNIKSLFLLTQEGNCQMAFKQNELCVGE